MHMVEEARRRSPPKEAVEAELGATTEAAAEPSAPTEEAPLTDDQDPETPRAEHGETE
jgi:hypothetical protein